ncbi:MAG: hypothetical protein RIC87_18640 [Kiloniellales bacterium]
MRRIGADDLLLAAADGGLAVETRSKDRLMLQSVIQLDGDIVTFVVADLPPETTLAKAHFQRVEAKLRTLIGSVNKLLATLIALPTAVIVGTTLPAAIEGEPAAWFALAAEALAAFGAVSLPGPRKLAARFLLRPAVKWMLRSRGRALLRSALTL